MERALSSHLCVAHRLTTAWLDGVSSAGIGLVEIFCARQHFDYRDQAQIAEAGHWFRDAPLKLHSLHAPMYTDDVWGKSGPQAVINITETTKAKRIQQVDEIKRTLEIAETVPYRYLIQHMGVAGEEYDRYKIDSAFTSLEEITVFARHRGVEVLIENTPNEFSSAARLQAFFEMTHLDLNVCFDIGHAHLRGEIAEEFRILKPRIRSTHIHDNNGEEDLHLFPFSGGTLDWAKAMTLLRSAPGQYPLMLELREDTEMAHPLDEVNRVFDELEGLETDE